MVLICSKLHKLYLNWMLWQRWMWKPLSQLLQVLLVLMMMMGMLKGLVKIHSTISTPFSHAWIWIMNFGPAINFFQEIYGVLWLTSLLLLLVLVFCLLHGVLPSWDGLEGQLHCFVLQLSPMFLHPSFLIVIELLILSLGKEITHTWLLLESQSFKRR